jgi:hypothetical protein
MSAASTFSLLPRAATCLLPLHAVHCHMHAATGLLPRRAVYCHVSAASTIVYCLVSAASKIVYCRLHAATCMMSVHAVYCHSSASTCNLQPLFCYVSAIYPISILLPVYCLDEQSTASISCLTGSLLPLRSVYCHLALPPRQSTATCPLPLPAVCFRFSAASM